jgi:hypothetical protein
LLNARAASNAAVTLADDVALLVCWLRGDILAAAEPSYGERCDIRRMIEEFPSAEIGGQVRNLDAVTCDVVVSLEAVRLAREIALPTSISK